MAARCYAPAYAMIRRLLQSRSQAEPLWTAREISDALTVWPVPSLRSIRRVMEQVRLKAPAHQSGHGGQSAPPKAHAA
jgi:hypothetical protein